ncbi:unnamed protein product [Protopolystoma xenopodis]|uniref:Uncharacterized protein n=1 Tax=Protopolystoma xenopodis TaxID=117903 RepID=A0A448WEX3_9PLAT|nr:unnamed protein product [Protopolystoma xenopodis]
MKRFTKDYIELGADLLFLFASQKAAGHLVTSALLSEKYCTILADPGEENLDAPVVASTTRRMTALSAIDFRVLLRSLAFCAKPSTDRCLRGQDVWQLKDDVVPIASAWLTTK